MGMRSRRRRAATESPFLPMPFVPRSFHKSLEIHPDVTTTLPRILLAFMLSLGVVLADEVGPRSPSAEWASMQLEDSRLLVELVAAEPELSSPVSMAWDESGNLYVAEMQDYPKSTDGGSIRLLQDRDGDGHYETATLFADHLPFPPVLPWKRGVQCRRPRSLVSPGYRRRWAGR